MKDHFFSVFELYYWRDSQEEYKEMFGKINITLF